KKTRDGDRDGKHARVARRHDADRQCDRERNDERREHDRHVLAERNRNLVPVAQEPRHAGSTPKAPLATRAASASTSGPSGRSSSSIGTMSRTPAYAARLPAPSEAGGNSRRSIAWAATSSS